MKVIEGGVTAAQGFLAAGLSAGIKKGNTKDMAMLYSKVPCEAAGTFTTNIVKAAPVKWDQKIVYESEKRRLLSVTVELQMPVQEKKDLAVVKKLQRQHLWH